MSAIFYDLETTDKIFVGQILNYAFIEVDDNYNIRSELCGLVRVGRLQLPSPEAILANRVDIQEHQAVAEDDERTAILKIWDYLADIGRNSRGPVKLIGYNSAKFDLPFLRTSMIRMGLNPYFENRITNGDLLWASRKLAASVLGFPRTPLQSGESSRLSLSLENLSHAFDILEGAQSHESKADVILTIKLAKIYRDKYGLDIQKYSGYEVPDTTKRGDILFELNPAYALEEGGPIGTLNPKVLVYNDHRNALWGSIEKFRAGKGRECISWYGKSASSFFVPSLPPVITEEDRADALRLLSEFEGLTVKNYFSKSICDIELDIYRLDFADIEALRLAIWERDQSALKALKTDTARLLFDRHRMSYYPWGKGHDEVMEKALKEYALYRYGGRMLINKFHSEDSFEKGIFSPHYHDTYTELLERLTQREREGGDGDSKLMSSLMKFYENSDIIRVAGPELLQIVRKKREVVPPSLTA